MELTIEQALQQGIAAHKDGKLEDAERLYRFILRSQPLHSDANHNLGVLAVSVNKLGVALPLFKTALESNQKIEQFWLSYIDSLIKDQQFESAKLALGQAKMQGFDNEKFSSLKVKIVPTAQTKYSNNVSPSQKQLSSLLKYYQTGKYGDAEKLATLITHEFPRHQFSWKVLGLVLGQTGRNSEAVNANQTAVLLSPHDAEARSNLGITLDELGRLEEAEASYTQAIALKPDYADAHSNLGNTLRKLGRLNEAVASYTQAITLKPDYAEAHNNLGNILRKLRKIDEAEQSYRQAILLKENFAEAHNNLANILTELGKIEDAEKSYRQAIVFKPNYAEAYYNLGATLKELGKLDEAEASYTQAIALKPDFAKAHSNLGVTLQKLDRLDEAEASYMQAIVLKPDYAEAHSNLGATLQKMGRLDESEASHTQAITLNPNLPEPYANLGNVLQEQGRPEKSIEAHSKALSINSDFSEAWSNIVFPLQTIKTAIISNDDILSCLHVEARSRFAQIEKSILNFKLHLGSPSVEDIFDELLIRMGSEDNRTIKNPGNHKITSEIGSQVPDNLITMVHFGRSGTGLLHSLIDGHPEVSTLPSIYLSQYFKHKNWENIISGGWDEMANRFIALYDVLFDATSSVSLEGLNNSTIQNLGIKEGMANLGEQQNEVLGVNKSLFRTELVRLMNSCDELDALSFFQLVHLAYDKAINDRNEKSTIFYHIHNPDWHALLNFSKFLPNYKSIIMVREPVQSLESWSRVIFSDNDYFRMSTSILKMLFEVDNIIHKKYNSIGVRLEDIKRNPQKTIPALCKWMGIKDTNSLYDMTAQGKKWWGDPSSPDFKNDGMKPFGKSSINRKIGSIFSSNDQFILRTLFYPFNVKFGYTVENFEQFKVDLNAISPMLKEMFDFEKTIAKRTKLSQKEFLKSGSYLYLRSGLMERWNTLNEFHTYPNMIEPLKVDFD